MLYDAHTHLNTQTLLKNWQKYYKKFIEAGGQGMVVVGIDPEHNQQAINLAEATRDKILPIKITLGIHPYEIGHGSVQNKKDVDKQIATIKKQVAQFPHYVVAIGETGIDAHYSGYKDNKDLQAYAFKSQCLLAQELSLPIVIHSRDQFDDTFAVIKQFPELNVYFHCRGYEPEEIDRLHKVLPNLRIGFCGNVTYPNATQLQESLKHTWELQENGESQGHHTCKALFETDAPYLTPQKRRGKTNHPALVRGIYEYASKFLDVESETLQEILKENYRMLYDY